MTAPHNHLRKPEPLRLRRIAAAAAVAACLAACASAPKLRTGDPSLPEIDVLQLKENSDEALKLAQENKLDLQSLESKVRELEGRISSLGDELANLPTARLDELGQQVALMTEQLHSLEERLAKPPAAPVKKELATFAPTALDSAGAGGKSASAKAEKATGKTAAKGDTASRGAASPAAKPASRKPIATDAEAAIYKKAFDLYYGRDYSGAIGRFEALLKQFPASTYADNCNYWIGECLFAQGNINKAIIAPFPKPKRETMPSSSSATAICAWATAGRRPRNSKKLYLCTPTANIPNGPRKNWPN
jgi:TolA-binding protein